MYEVEAETVDLGPELGKSIELFLLSAPIEAASPVIDQLPHVPQPRTVVPVRAFDLVGLPGMVQACTQVV